MIPIFYLILCSKNAGIRFKLMIGLIALQGDNSLMPAGWFMHKFTKEKRTKKENYSNSSTE
jgi:hypothetical protein